MKYGSEFLENKNYLATLLLADYLLKMLTMGTEVSSKKPFLFRDGEHSFLHVLTEFLRLILSSTSREGCVSNNGRVHRFWNKATDLPYTNLNERENNEIQFIFVYFPMIVKKQMKHDSDGKLLDEEDSEDEDEFDDKNNSIFRNGI